MSKTSLAPSGRSLAVVLTGAVLAAGCATPYRPPQTPPPAQWSGAHGLIDTGPAQIHTGLVREGQPIVSTPVRFRRTGVLAKTVETKTAYGGRFVLPAGSQAFATNYTLYVGSTYSKPKNVQTEIDPIEWCVIAPNGFDGQKPGAQTACLFWESPERARWMEDFTVGGFAFAPYVDIGGAAGMAGPVPEIIEQPVDFGVQLSRVIQVLKVEPKGVRLGVGLSDGEHSRIQERRTLRWSPAGDIVIAGARIRPTADDPHGVDVSRAAP